MTNLFTNKIIFSITLLTACVGSIAADLSGLYVETKIFGGSISINSWLIKGNNIIREPDGDAKNIDFKAAAVTRPDAVGTLKVSGEEMTVQWANNSKKTARLEIKEKGCFYWDAGLFCKVQSFSANEKLEGKFSGGIGGGGAGSSQTISFSADGNYKMSRAGSVTTSGDKSGAYAGSSSEEAGVYRLGANTITFTPTSGALRTLAAFPYDDGSAGKQPRRLYVGGFMLKRISD